MFIGRQHRHPCTQKCIGLRFATPDGVVLSWTGNWNILIVIYISIILFCFPCACVYVCEWCDCALQFQLFLLFFPNRFIITWLCHRRYRHLWGICEYNLICMNHSSVMLYHCQFYSAIPFRKHTAEVKFNLEIILLFFCCYCRCFFLFFAFSVSTIFFLFIFIIY